MKTLVLAAALAAALSSVASAGQLGYCTDTAGNQLNVKACAQMQRISARVPHMTAVDWALAQPNDPSFLKSFTEIWGREGGGS